MAATSGDDVDLAQRFDELWASDDDPEVLVERFRALAETDGHTAPALAAFELASVLDYAGQEQAAEQHYRHYLAADDPDPGRRRRATIQLASTLRLLGRPDQSAALLEELLRGPRHEHTPAATAFLALSLHDAGRPDDALAAALRELCGPIVEYQQSLRTYIAELVAKEHTDGDGDTTERGHSAGPDAH